MIVNNQSGKLIFLNVFNSVYIPIDGMIGQKKDFEIWSTLKRVSAREEKGYYYIYSAPRALGRLIQYWP